jgi:hypothetical protein
MSSRVAVRLVTPGSSSPLVEGLFNESNSIEHVLKVCCQKTCTYAMVDGDPVEPKMTLSTLRERVDVEGPVVVECHGLKEVSPVPVVEVEEDASSVVSPKRNRSPQIRGLPYHRLKVIPNVERLLEKLEAYSIREKRTLEVHGEEGLAGMRPHTCIEVLRQFFGILDRSPMKKDFVAADLVNADMLEVVLDTYQSSGQQPNSVKKRLDTLSSTYTHMIRLVKAFPGCFGEPVTVASIERVQERTRLAAETYRRDYLASGRQYHFESEWVARGKWLSADEWKFLKEGIVNALRAFVPRGVHDARRYEGLLMTGLCVFMGGLRTEVLSNLFLRDLVERPDGLVIRVVFEKTTTKANASGAARTARPVRVIPVAKEIAAFMRGWRDRYRHFLASQQETPKEHFFLNMMGKPVGHGGGAASLVKETCVGLVGKQLTPMDLRHLRVTHVVRKVMKMKVSESERRGLLEAQARLAGHSLDMMMSVYYIRGDNEVEGLLEAMNLLNELVGEGEDLDLGEVEDLENEVVEE